MVMLLAAAWALGWPIAVAWFRRDARRWGERTPWSAIALWPAAAVVLAVVHGVGWVVRTLPRR